MKVSKTHRVGEIEVTISAEASLDEMYDPKAGTYGLRPTFNEGLTILSEWIDTQIEESDDESNTGEL